MYDNFSFVSKIVENLNLSNRYNHTNIQSQSERERLPHFHNLIHREYWTTLSAHCANVDLVSLCGYSADTFISNKFQHRLAWCFFRLFEREKKRPHLKTLSTAWLHRPSEKYQETKKMLESITSSTEAHLYHTYQQQKKPQSLLIICIICQFAPLFFCHRNVCGASGGENGDDVKSFFSTFKCHD